MQQKIKEILHILNNYRLYSKNYVNMSYFAIFAFIVLKYSEYVVKNHIQQIGFVTLLLPFLVLLFIPIMGLYYIIKTGIGVYKVSKTEKFENKNKFVFISDIIYIAIVIYVHFFINYKH